MRKNKEVCYNKEQGYIILLSILIVGAVGLVIAVSLLLFGYSSSHSSFNYQQSAQAQALADTCLELALLEISNSVPYVGSGNLVLGQGSCSWTVVDTGGQIRLINASAIVGSVVSKVQAVTSSLRPQIKLDTWARVADF